MKCQEFETIIMDLARDRIMEAAERETALAHAHSCSECAGILADQQTLTAGLRRLAAASLTLEAPESVQTRLQAAFRERSRIRAATRGNDGPDKKGWRRREWVAAAAIALLIAAGFIAWRFARAVPGDDARRAVISPQPEAPARSEPTPPAPPEQRSGVEVDRPDLAAPASRNRDRAPGLRPYRAQSARPVNRSNRPAPRVEIATDFIPVSGADLMPMDGGLVVRVELPRSAMMSFGLPVNMERADERIKADVVLGNDGFARAIRFVQ